MSTAPETSIYDQVFTEYLAHAKDPAWRMAFEIALGEWMGEIATSHQGPIQAIADRAVIRSLNSTRDDITKNFLLTRLAEIRKDRDWDARKHARGGNPENRGQFSRGAGSPRAVVYDARHEAALGEAIGAGFHMRSPQSQARYEARQVHHEQRAQARADFRGQASAVAADRMRRLTDPDLKDPAAPGRRDFVGIATQPVTLDPATSPIDHKAEVLRERARMTYLLQDKTLNSGDKQRIQYTITGPRGSRVEVPSAGALPDGIDWDGGERIQYMTPVGADIPASVAGRVMDVMQVAGVDSDAAAKAGSVVADIHDTLNTTEWGKRLANVANVARVVSNNHPAVAQAHAVASMAQILGPDAARAFGPKMRQLSYRYTGQEAGKGQMSPIAAAGKQESTKGQLETTQAFEARLAHELAKDLPRATEYKAALEAGSTPPSKGFLLDKNGRVVSESVGFADDWYTPFNLRRLPKLSHGSYVRTRGYGGLTPEDIQLALHTGAARATVVSNSGVFTIEFDDRARQPGHRFGFGGTSMYRRYSKSLDAIKNANVKGADGNALQLDQRGYGTALQDLKNKYPYFVASVKVENPINAQATAAGESVAGTPERQKPDEGYVRPLGLRASGAKSGYADPYVDGQKVAYDQLDAYRLRRAQFGALQLKHDAKAPEAQTGTRPGTSAPKTNAELETERRVAAARKAAEERGEGKSVASYAEGDGAQMEPSDVGQELAQLRRVIQQDLKGEAESADVQALIVALGSGEKKGDRGYDEAFKKYRTSEDFRKRVYNDLGEIYLGHDLTDQILPGLMGAKAQGPASPDASDADPDAPDDMAALDDDGFYEMHMRIPRSAIVSSPAIQSWLQDLRIQAAPELGNDKRAELQLQAFDRYIEVQETDVRNRNNDAYNALDPAERDTYDRMHTRVIQKLNHERGQEPVDDEPEPTPAPATAAPRKLPESLDPNSSRALVHVIAEVLESADKNEAFHFGKAMVDDIINGEDIDGAETEQLITRRISQLKSTEARMRQQDDQERADLVEAAAEGMRRMAKDITGRDF